jgi:DNA segregation ATPase FtsK/SpoIIIE-like protein
MTNKSAQNKTSEEKSEKNTHVGGPDQGELLRSNAAMLELTLQAFGLPARIAEINILETEYEYCLEVAMGYKANKIFDYETDIALALASPSGKVRIQVPIPGRALIGIYVPKSKKESNVKPENYKVIRIKEEKREDNKPKPPFRSFISDFLYLIANIFVLAADRIYKPPEKE